MITESHNAKEKKISRAGNVFAWLLPSEFKARLRSVFAARVPMGYEDETGFHIGRKPSPVRSDPASRGKF
jgi:hypothetical protein